jgi:DNA-binding NtrC family response regulator
VTIIGSDGLVRHDRVAPMRAHDDNRATMAKKTGRVLIADDEANARSALADILTDEGYETCTASDGRKALALMASFDPDVVLTDLKMPVMDGLELLEQGRLIGPHTSFIVMTAFGSIETAVAAVKRGAENYLTKPLDTDAVAALVERALEKSRLSREAARLREQVGTRLSMKGILGDHPAMQRVLKTVEQVGKSRATVLIHGESGTGKELIAAAIHHNSPRREKAFVRLNCAALAESLLESELFGHERGAFTGAAGRREGRFKQADGGTLFLDEISEVPIGTQVKLLRFLQERAFERVGSNETVNVDVRIVAATNKDLTQRVERGEFREDLYYRLNVVQIDVPPLRARRSDIPVLAQHFLAKFADENGGSVTGFTDEALGALMSYAWPGNVRELENAIERAVVLADSSLIGVAQLPMTSTRKSRDDIGILLPGVTMKELERIAIERTLASVGGSTVRAAEILGISRRTIQYRLREWNGDEPMEGEPDEE